jgi:hypothetical protein
VLPVLHCLAFLQDIAHARLEFEITCFGAVQDLLNKTGGYAHACAGCACVVVVVRWEVRADDCLGRGCAGIMKVAQSATVSAVVVHSVQNLANKMGRSVRAHAIGGGGCRRKVDLQAMSAWGWC